jgi:drug/metabolite transporter (DMT)-like permease
MNGSAFGYLLAFISMIAGALSTFPFTDATRKWGAVAVNHYRLIVAFIILTIIVMVVDKKSFIALFTIPSATEYTYLFISGIIGLVLGDYFGFHSMAILGAKRFSIFNSIAPGAALGFGFVLVGERINFIGILGIAVSIGGMMWFIQASNTKEIEQHQIHEYGKISKGVLFGILSGLCQGFQMALAKKAITGESFVTPVHATWVRVLGATVAYFVFTFITGRFNEKVITPIRREKTTMLKAAFATILGIVLSVVLFMWSLTLCKVAVTQTILSLAPIVALPMAYFLYKERMTTKTLLAGLVSIFGVYLLIWRDDIATIFGLHLH